MDLVGKVKQLAAEIVLRAKTGEGAEQAAGDFRKVETSAGEAATVLEKTEKVTESAERAYEKLKRRLDPLSAAQERLARDQKALDRALEQGVIKSVAEYDKRLGQLRAEHDRVKARIDRTHNAQQGLNREMSLFGPAANAAKGALAGFLAGLSFAALNKGAREAIAALDEIAKKARSLGGIDQAAFLQEARFALGQQGFTEEGVDKALAKLNRNVGDLRLGQSDSGLGRVLKDLEGGEQLREQLKSARDLGEQYELIIGKLNGIDDAATRASLAQAAFGKEAGANIGAAAEDGVEGFRRLREQARDSGIVIEKELLERAETLNDRLSLAGRIAQTQLRRAFLEVGAVIADMAEGAALFLKRIVDAVRAANLSKRDVTTITDADSLTLLKGTLEGDLDRLRRTGTTGAILAGPITASELNPPTSEIAALEAHLARVNAQLDILGRGGVIHVDQLSAALERGTAFAGEYAEALTTLREKRDAALERLDAARGGRGALESFDRSAAIEAAVKASGAVGAAADEARRLVTEIMDAEKATQQLERGFKKVESAARAVKFDPVGGLDAEIGRLEQLIEAARLGPEELERAEQRLAIEDKIARLKVEASRAAADLDEDAVRARLETIERLTTELRQTTERRLDDGGARRVADPMRRALYDVADDFVRRLARGDASAFRDFARRLKDILFDAVIDPFAQAFASMISGLFGGFGANPAGSIFTPGVVGGFGAIAPYTPGIIGGAGAGAFGGAGGVLGAAGFGFLGGSMLSDLFGLEGKAARSLTGATTGAAAGFQLGTVVPGIGNAVGAIVGGVVGALAGLFGGPPSNKVGVVAFDPATGRTVATATKDQSADALRNLEVAQAVQSGITQSIEAILKVTGGDLGALLLQADAGNREGIRLYENTGAAFVQRGAFENSEEGVKKAIEAGIRLALANIQGGDPALTAVIRQLTNAGEPLDKMLGRVEKLAAALDVANEPVDIFRQRLDALIEAFDGLDRSSGALKEAFDGAVAALSERANEDNRKALEAIVNPERAAVQAIVEEQDRRRAALEDINAQGGNVDLSLLDRLNREQILAQFNIGARLAQASDPVAFGIDQLLARQARELAALKSVVDNVRIFDSDVEALQRTQSQERVAAFAQLSTEDKIRLSGRAEEFENLGGRYAFLLDRLNEEIRRQTNDLATTVAGLERTVADRRARSQSVERAIFDLDRFGGQVTPGASLQSLRDTALQLAERAKNPDDIVARDLLPQAIRDFVEKSRAVNASSAAFTTDFDLGRELLVSFRAQLDAEGTDAERQLEAINRNGDLLAEIRDILSQPQLNIERFAEAAGRLDPDNPLAPIALSLLELQAQQADQNERLIALLEALRPADVGLEPAALSTALAGAPATALSSAPPPPVNPDSVGLVAAPTTAAGGSKATSREADIIDGLFAVASAIDAQTLQDAKLAKEQKKRDDAALTIHKIVANRKAVA